MNDHSKSKEVVFDDVDTQELLGSAEINKKRLFKIVEDTRKYPFCNIIISKYKGIIKSYKLEVEVRFKEVEHE